MGRQIIKKPDGTYAIWSTITDDFLFNGITIEYWIAYRKREAAEEVEKDIREIAEELARGGKPYLQFTISYEEAIAQRDRMHYPKAEPGEDQYAQPS